jgi:hypothetical protein
MNFTSTHIDLIALLAVFGRFLLVELCCSSPDRLVAILDLGTITARPANKI